MRVRARVRVFPESGFSSGPSPSPSPSPVRVSKYAAQNFKYYLIHEKECFIILKTRGAAERFRYDKTLLFECIKLLQIRRVVMLNRMQHYIKNTNERDRLYKVSS